MSEQGFIRPLDRNQLVLDLSLAGALLVLCVAPLPLEIESPGVTTALFSVGALAVRRLSPTLALILTWLMAISLLIGAERPSIALLSLLIVVATVAAVGSQVELVVSGVSAFIGGVLASGYLALTGFRFVVLLNGGSAAQNLLVAFSPIAILGSAWLVGFALRARAQRSAESLRSDAAERVASQATERALAESIRTEMARDVHDVVGHSLAVIIAQADSVEFVDDTRVREIVAVIAKTARSSLAEVRSVLEQTTDVDREPELPELDDLIAQVEAAGVTIDLVRRGTPRPLDTTTALLTKRVMQEMLTNALRHARPGAPVSITETWRSNDMVIEVANEVGEVPNPGSGQGLSGMRSRLATVGGELEAEAVEGVFSARARIPVSEGTNE